MSDKINMVQAINWALDDAMADDPMVLVLGEDVADHTGGGARWSSRVAVRLAERTQTRLFETVR